MGAFVENLVESVEDAAKATADAQRDRPVASDLIKALAGKRNILITGHRNPDPDALGASAALQHLLSERLPDLPRSGGRPQLVVSHTGITPGGVNAPFVENAPLNLAPWDDARLSESDGADAYDAVILVDAQPSFPGSPLPSGVVPTAIVDHHSARGRRPSAPFVDIRPDVGATTSIVFSYMMELDVDPDPALAAMMLHAIETDLAGAAGQPDGLDNAALAALTVRADTRQLYRMRHVELPQHYFVGYADALADARLYGRVLVSNLGKIRYTEKPAVIADFLLRFAGADYAVVTALFGDDGDGHPERLVLSVRAGRLDLSAGEMLRRAMADFGEGGGHRTKAGGFVLFDNGSQTEIERVRLQLRRRILESLRIDPAVRGKRLLELQED
ncbi:MAG: DHH family phosphoesterase [Planctomycetota bacterium]